MAQVHQQVATVNWIDVMGGPEVNVTARFDFDSQQVFVDAENLLIMAGGWIDAAILPDTDTIATTRDLLAIEPNQGGEYNVTVMGGGWGVWLGDRLGVEQPLYFDHEGNRTTDPRCELGLCVTCNDEALSRFESPQPALSVSDPRYARDEAYRARVHAAFKALGVTYREDPNT